MKKLLIALTGFMFAFAAHAAPATPPDDVVKGTTDQLLKLLAQNHAKYKADLPGFYKVVDDIVVPHFDVRYIGQLVLARNWKTASDDQRTRFQTAFKNMLIRAYSNSLIDNYSSVQVQWQPLRLTPAMTDVTVNSQLVRKDGPPINISFLMHAADDQWLIYDILIENLSLVSNFRAQFAEEIKKNGLDAVISRMESGQYVGNKPAPAGK